MTKKESQAKEDATTSRSGLKMRMIKLARVLVARIPPAAGHPLAAVLGELTYRVDRRSRRAAISNLGHAMGPVSRRTLKKTVRHVFHNAMRNYYELCRAPDMTDDYIDRMTDFDERGWQKIVDLHNSGRGVIIASAHYGSFDMVTQVLARHGFPVSVLAARIKPAWFSDFITDLRADRGLDLLMVDDEDSAANLTSLKKSITVLKNGGLLGMIVDRNLEPKGVKIKFFGHDTVVAAGVAKLALRTGAPIVIGIARRLNSYRFSVTFEEPMELTGSASNEEDVRALLTKVFARLEYHIAQNPEQWTLLQPVWPNEEEKARLENA
jgi:lauroyl/myristoyl acyltransferase